MSGGVTEPVRVGVIGLGFFGTLHAETLNGIAEAELVAVCARRQQSLDQFVKKGLSIPGYTDIGRAIEESGAEAWVVAASSSAHIPITKLLLEADISVLLEKPLAVSLEEAATIRSLVETSKGRLMLGHILLFGTEFREVCDEARKRGGIRYVSAERHRPVALRDDPILSPFNLVMIHDLYCLQVLMNGKEPTSLSAQARNAFAGSTFDLGLAQLKWDEETVASLTASFLTPEGMGLHGFDRLEIFGDGWAARLNSNPRPIQIWDESSRYPLGIEIRSNPPGPTGMLAEEQRAFCRVVRGQQDIPFGATYEEAMQVMGWIAQLEALVTPSK